jgi:hypothetical protein
MALTANAATAEDVLWSDTFDEQTTGVLVSGAAGNASSTAISGLTIAEHSRGGDGNIAEILEKEDASDKYLALYIERFCDQSTRYAKATFDTTYAPTADKDLIFDFDLKMTDGVSTDSEEAWEDCALRMVSSSGKIMTVLRSENSELIPNDTWVDARLVINSTSGATFYVNGTEVDQVAAIKDLQEIRLYADGQYKGQKPTVALDNVVIYTDEDGENSVAPEPTAQGEQEQTYTYAPKGSLPDNMGIVVEDDLNSIVVDRYIITANGTESEYTAINGIILRTGAGDADRGESNWKGIISGEASLDEPDRYLVANSGAGSTANRGPKLEFSYGEIAERETVVAQFATRLHAGTSAPAELIFSGDLVASSSKGNLASPLAMITTDATADSAVYAVDNALTTVADGGTNVLEVNDNEWVLVTIEATRAQGKAATAKISVTTNVGEEDENTVYIFGSEDEYADMKDSSKSGIYTLPFISFRSGNDGDYGVSGSSNDIDNIAVYSSNAEPPVDPVVVTATLSDSNTKLNLTADKETAAVVIKVKTDEDGNFESASIVKTYTSDSKLGTTDTIELEDVEVGDKFFVWSTTNSIVPFLAIPVVAEAE